MSKKINAADVANKLQSLCNLWETMGNVNAPITESHCINALNALDTFENWSQTTFMRDCVEDYQKTVNNVN